MDPARIADHPPSPLVFSVDALDDAVDAFLDGPQAHVIISSEGRSIDVTAVVRADGFASRAVASPGASLSHRRMAVRTAILLARSEKP